MVPPRARRERRNALSGSRPSGPRVGALATAVGPLIAAEADRARHSPRPAAADASAAVDAVDAVDCSDSPPSPRTS